MEQLSDQAVKNRAVINDIRSRMLRGELTHDQAKAQVQPIIDAMNARGKELAKEYGMRHKTITFAYLMR